MAKTSSKSSPWGNSHCKQPFLLFWCIPCTITLEVSSSSKNISNTDRLSRLSFRFLWLCKKATISDSIPLKILKISSEVSADALQNLFNMLKTGNISDNLKLVDVTPVLKWKNPLHKVNYRLVSLLPSISKVFEKLMQKQRSGYISNYLSPYLYRYRKGFSSQSALLPLTKNLEKDFRQERFWSGCINGPI